MKIYISGAIRNNPNYKKQFEIAENRIAYKGYIPVNPANAYNSIIENNFSDTDLLDLDLKLLEKCDAIYMLKGWHSSVGANKEFKKAIELNKKIMYEEVDESNFRRMI